MQVTSWVRFTDVDADASVPSSHLSFDSVVASGVGYVNRVVRACSCMPSPGSASPLYRCRGFPILAVLLSHDR